MTEIIKAIEAKDRVFLSAALKRLAESPSLTVDVLLEVLKTLPSIVVAFPEQFTVEHKGDHIIWYRYETLIWEIGDVFRQILKRLRALRKDPNLFRDLERVALDPQFHKGRESFVMLLGQYGNRDAVDTLQRLLDDQEVQGHAVYALRLLGAPEVQDSIRPFLQSPKTWVRNEAKKYFQKLEKRRIDILPKFPA